jgi:hypothetical protein
MELNLFKILQSNSNLSVNKQLAHALGLDAAIFYQELLYQYSYFESRGQLDDDGMFYSTVDNMAYATTMTDYQQRKAINKLKEVGLIDSMTKGMPAKRYFKIYFDIEILNQLLALGFEKMEEVKNKDLKNSKACDINSSQKTKEQGLKFFEISVQKTKEQAFKKLHLNNTNNNTKENNTKDNKKTSQAALFEGVQVQEKTVKKKPDKKGLTFLDKIKLAQEGVFDWESDITFSDIGNYYTSQHNSKLPNEPLRFDTQKDVGKLKRIKAKYNLDTMKELFDFLETLLDRFCQKPFYHKLSLYMIETQQDNVIPYIGTKKKELPKQGNSNLIF